MDERCWSEEVFPTLTFQELIEECYQNALEHGFWHKGVNNDDIPEKLMLQVTEIAEAMEDYRNGKSIREITFTSSPGGPEKPDGFTVELADVIIRILDMAGAYELPLLEAMRLKMRYNRSRPYRHGNKLA